MKTFPCYKPCQSMPGIIPNKQPFVVVVLALMMYFVWTSAAFCQTLRIYHIDVEQGDSSLFVSPSGKSLLVDSGKNGHGQRIKNVMDQAGVSQIDVFVDTHYHEDHYGGIDNLAGLVTIVQAFDRGDKTFLPSSKLNEGTFKDYQQAVGEDATQLRRGMQISLDPQMTITCVAAGGVVIGEQNPETGVDENDMSVALLISYEGFRYFIGGDIEEHTEVKIADRDLVRNVDVYQANHHGSHTSSSLAFMQDLSPRVVIISNGNNSRYEHPRKTTLQLYQGLPTSPTVFQTNKYLQGGLGGNVADAFIADPESSDQDGTILVTVDASAGTYAVTYGTSSRTFQTKDATSGSNVVIESVLPNPVGLDEQLEEATIKNKGTDALSLAGWVLRDAGGATWSFSGLGSLAAGESKTIQRNGMAMSLNNSGDEITLKDTSGVVRDTFSYPDSQEGVRISTGH